MNKQIMWQEFKCECCGKVYLDVSYSEKENNFFCGTCWGFVEDFEHIFNNRMNGTITKSGHKIGKGHHERTNRGRCTWEEFKKTLIKFKLRCPYTNEILTVKNVQIEHVISIRKGGSNDAINLLPALKEFNQSKFTRDFKEWYPTCKWYDEKRYNTILKIYELAIENSKAYNNKIS